MSNKKYIIILLMILCLSAISSVSANDLNDNMTLAEDNGIDNSGLIAVEDVNQTIYDDTNDLVSGEDTLSVSLSEDELSAKDDGTFTALQKKINDAEEGSTITLENDYKYNEGFDKSGISINKKLTINGNGYTIDGNNNARIFNIFKANPNLNNINIINAYWVGSYSSRTNYGGAIYCVGDLTVNDCTFTNNGGCSYGGAINSFNGVLTVENCNFINNYASYGGAIYCDDTNYDFEYHIKNSNFIGNTARYGGGAIYSEGNVHSQGNIIESVNFINNTAESGGAIELYKTANTVVTDCTFTNNYNSTIFFSKVLSGEREEYSYDLVFSNLNFDKNNDYGGGISVEDNQLIINGVYHDYWTDGGGIKHYYDVYISGDVLVDISGKVYQTSFNSKGKATVDLKGLSSGVHDAKISYGGDENYGAFDITIPISVESSINLDVPDVTKNYGGPERLEVTLTEGGSPVANANVNININGVDYTRTTDANGKASLGLNLNAGSYDATVTYKDISTKAKVVINKLTTKNTLSYAKNSHNSVTLTALIDPSTASGDVVFTVNGKDYSAKVNSGKATYTLNNLAVGSYSAVAKYKGDVNHKESSSNSVKFTVEDVKIEVSAPDLTKYYNGPERFVVTVKEDYKAVVGKNVTINLNGRSYIRTTDSDGQASMAINLNSGKYKITTEYGGIKVYSTVTVKDTVISKDFTKIFRNDTQYYATFVDSQGNVLKNTPVRLNINGVYYTRTTSDQGIAKMNINLNPGTYILTAENPASGEQHTTVITVLPSIVENHDLTKFYKNESKYTLRILGGNGKPVGEGVIVKLNINGVFYERKTNATGYMNMNINLPPGTYTVTAEYNGLRASNTIKVLPTIQTKDLYMKYRDGSKFEAKILDDKGKPYAGQSVTYNINGVFYNRISDDNGIARLNINLQAGQYIITTTFNGLNEANKVTISS